VHHGRQARRRITWVSIIPITFGLIYAQRRRFTGDTPGTHNVKFSVQPPEQHITMFTEKSLSFSRKWKREWCEIRLRQTGELEQEKTPAESIRFHMGSHNNASQRETINYLNDSFCHISAKLNFHLFKWLSSIPAVSDRQWSNPLWDVT